MKSFLKPAIVSVTLTVALCQPAARAQTPKPKPAHVLSADEAKSVKKDASTTFLANDFRNALPLYLDLYATDNKNAEYNYRLGYCYLMTYVDKKAALKYMEYAAQSKDAKKDWLFTLGMAFMYNNQFDEAIKSFQDYKKATNNKVIKEFPPVDRMIEMCNNGKDLVAHPVNVEFTNLGKIVNSSFEEYNPFISADNTTLVFSSKRKGNVGGVSEELGTFAADIYTTTWKDTIWTKAKGLGGTINTEGDEESTGLSPNGDEIIMFIDNREAIEDIATTTLKGKMWQKTVMLSNPVNTKDYEGGACISADRSTLYFSAHRKDGLGGIDLYMSHKNDDGQWGVPVNLGSDINTKYDEEGPFITADGKTLYFSSKGHNSMGGYDLFKSVWDENASKWLPPVNLGYPVNDADDNMHISFTGDGRYAYVGELRPDGLGDRDIWRIEFKDTTNHPFKTVIKGSLAPASGKVELTKAYLENKSTHIRAEFKPASSSNDFILTASPGEYSLHVEGINFSPYDEDITVGNDFPPKLITKSIAVQPAK